MPNHHQEFVDFASVVTELGHDEPCTGSQLLLEFEILGDEFRFFRLEGICDRPSEDVRWMKTCGTPAGGDDQAIVQVRDQGQEMDRVKIENRLGLAQEPETVIVARYS
jgi:hypothetical protein